MFECRCRGLRSRRSVLPQSEQLETRALLSASHRFDHPPTTAVTDTVSMQAPSTVVTQQANSLSVTLDLATDSTTTHYATTRFRDPIPHVTNKTSVPIPDTSPVTVTLNAKPSPYTGPQTNAAAANDTFAPFSAPVTFPAGVTSETVSIPIPAGSADSGAVLLQLSVTSPSPAVADDQAPAVFIVDNPAELPPTITGVHLVDASGHHASGIAITFSKPMAPATVENIHNYSISSLGMSSGVQLPAIIGGPLSVFVPYRIFAAAKQAERIMTEQEIQAVINSAPAPAKIR